MRPFEPRDDEAVVALYERLHADDPSIDAIDLERWRAFRAMPLFDGGRRFLVVERDDRIVAISTLGQIIDRRAGGLVWRVRIFVDPGQRRRGIARALLAQRQRQATSHGVRAIETFMNASWTPARAFAERHGFSVFVHDLFLARDTSAFVAPVPTGVTLRAHRGEPDHAAWAALANATLSRDAVFVEETPQSVAGYARMNGFGLWLAEDKGTPVGFCHLERRGRDGYVQAIGVLATHEGRGIGAALLSHGIDTLRAPGVERIELCTERDNARAQRLYARAGFVLDREALTYRKVISGV